VLSRKRRLQGNDFMTSPSAAEAVDIRRPQRTFLGHPVGLYVLFLAEMWERFSFYGMRALLILYMVNYFRMRQEEASGIYKWYASLVYLTPLVGGYLADRYLGNKRAVIIGAVLMAIGHFLMAFEPLPAFYSALVFLIIGNGFFKPNMATQVGRLYPANDPRRDGAYTIYYMGVNLGAFLSPLACGWLAENTVGRYHSGFTIAGVGMVCGLVIYLVGQPWVRELAPGSKSAAPVPGAVQQEAKEFLTALRSLQKQTMEARSSAFVAMVHMPKLPETLDIEQVGFKEEEVRFVRATRTLLATRRLGENDVQALYSAAFPDQSPTARSGSAAAPGQPMSEQAAEQAPSALPWLNEVAPWLLTMIGFVLIPLAPILAVKQLRVISWDTAIALELTAISALFCAWILSKTQRAVRDRVLAILVLGVFVVFFWAAYEQAGNAMNLWADKATNRYLTAEPKPPDRFPPTMDDSEMEGREEGFWDRWLTMFQSLPSDKSDAAEGWGDWWTKQWNPMPTAWFQSINALAIFVLAPPFAWLWTTLGRRGWNPSTPTKMAVGILLMASAFAVMIWAAQYESGATSVALAPDQELPPEIGVNSLGQLYHREASGKSEPPYHAGRLTYDAETHTLNMTGVLTDTERDRILQDTASLAFAKNVKELRQLTEEAHGPDFRVSVHLDEPPPKLDLRYTGLTKRKLDYDPQTQTLTSTMALADKDVKALLVAGSDPELRETLNQLMINSSKYRVSSWWLVWFYLLSTVGELCLSPVGLSMVSKLAPVKFATMLMGLWMLTSFFGEFAAGAFGEIWGTVPPLPYFMIFLAALTGAALVLFLLVRKIVAMMHGVN
jgi:dipeptide/tripeptide permease